MLSEVPHGGFETVEGSSKVRAAALLLDSICSVYWPSIKSVYDFTEIRHAW
jgi:hypothetical protein